MTRFIEISHVIEPGMVTNLAELPVQGGRLHAVPIAWRGGATFPVRAYVHYP